MSSQPEAYIFPHLIQEKVSTKEGSGQVVNTNSSSDTNKIIHNGRNVNVMEQEEAWVIYMDLPGVKGENVDIEEDNGTLKVNAQRKAGDKVLATYQQHFALDPKTADLSKLSTELADGVLTITIPKKPKPAPLTIQVLPEDAPDVTEEEEAKEFRYTFELPGVKAGGVKVEFQDGVLRLDAERKNGRYTSSFQRMFTVGQSVDMSHAKAYLVDGMFTIVAPRMEEAKSETRKICLENGASKQ